MTERRTCNATTKRGTPCTRPALADSLVCLAHSAKAVREEIGFGGPQIGSGRPTTPRVMDVLREKVEAAADEIVAVYLETLRTAEKPILVGLGMGEQRIEWVTDLGARMQAAERLLDRAYGRPKQTSEVEVSQPASIDPKKLSDAELSALLVLIDKARPDEAVA